MPSLLPIYDVLIPFHDKDLPILPYCVASVRQHAIGAQTIYVVSANNPQVEGVVWIDEATLPFTKQQVGEIITYPPRVGWYLQQLVKLYGYRYLPTKKEHLLILDSDTILKKTVRFFDHSGKICFGFSTEDTTPYFVHMGRLIPGLTKQIPEYSGICHHIMTRRDHLEEILSTAEKVHGKEAWRAMLELVEEEDYPRSGMADYEIYFNYCLQRYPGDYVIRALKVDNLCNFGEFARSDADMVALHAWARTL
jgi:hypothetical protein